MPKPEIFRLSSKGVSVVNAELKIAFSAVGHGERFTSYVRFNAGTTAGTILLEVADDPDYTGTWGRIATLGWTAANTIETRSFADPHEAVRLRVSDAVLNGDCDLTFMVY